MTDDDSSLFDCSSQSTSEYVIHSKQGTYSSRKPPPTKKNCSRLISGMIRLLKDIFANKLSDDNRIDDPIFTFEVPVFGGKTCSFIPPDFAFYYQLVSVSKKDAVLAYPSILNTYASFYF